MTRQGLVGGDGWLLSISDVPVLDPQRIVIVEMSRVQRQLGEQRKYDGGSTMKG